MKSKNQKQAAQLQKTLPGLVPLLRFDKYLFKPLLYFVIVTVAVITVSCSRTSGELHGNKPLLFFKQYSNKVILEWNTNTLEMEGGLTYTNTLTASRLNAMVHIAMHDALNSIVDGYETYALNAKDREAHPIAAAATAAYTVLLRHFAEKKTTLDGMLAAWLDTISAGNAKERGINLGKQAADAIIALRNHDGADQNPISIVPPSTVPGVYQHVLPFDFVFAPFWKTMQPFGLQRPDQFRSVPQPALNSAIYAKDYNEVKAYGSKNSTQRSADQTFYAKFWYEFSEIGWNRIGRIAATDHKLDLLSTARLMALLNIVLADSYIAGWDSKFHYDFWRPYTAIRGAANDGNDKTEADANWETLMPTPPVQDYPSTHSVLGNAGATVLTAFFGNSTSFTMISSTSDPAGAPRTLKSFLKAADENADSRVMAGIHFRFSTKAGQEMGNTIGKWVLQNHLRPRP